MLGRNDRKALKRNRSAVSWLFFLCIGLSVWITNLYNDISYNHEMITTIRQDLSNTQEIAIRRNSIIDSLNKVIKDINQPDTTSKILIKKDNFHRFDSSLLHTQHPVKIKDSSTKDTLKPIVVPFVPVLNQIK